MRRLARKIVAFKHHHLKHELFKKLSNVENDVLTNNTIRDFMI